MTWKKGLFLMLLIYVFIITWSYFFLTQNNLIFLSSSPHSQHAIHLSWTLSITHTQIIYSTYLKTLAFESISILNYPFIMPTLSQWFYMTKKNEDSDREWKTKYQCSIYLNLHEHKMNMYSLWLWQWHFLKGQLYGECLKRLKSASVERNQHVHFSGLQNKQYKKLYSSKLKMFPSHVTQYPFPLK